MIDDCKHKLVLIDNVLNHIDGIDDIIRVRRIRYIVNGMDKSKGETG